VVVFAYIIFVRVLQSFEKYGVCLNVNNRLTVITAARPNGRVPRRPQGRCSPRQLKILVKLAF